MESLWIAHQFFWTAIEAIVAVFLLVGLVKVYPNLHAYWIQTIGLLAMFTLMFLPHGYVFLFGTQNYEWGSFFGIKFSVPHTSLLIADMAGTVMGLFVGMTVHAFMLARSKLSW